jgi:hypothetical protein
MSVQQPESIRGFQLHLTSSGAGVHRQRHHRVVLTPEKVERFLEAAPGITCLRDSLTESLQYRF